VYQSTLRVPLVMAGPGLPAGAVRGGLARSADVLPTLLAQAGVAAPSGLDGRDLMAGAAREAYAETEYPQSLGFAPLRSLRAGALKYIEAPRPELYDLAADPGETRNLAGGRAADVERMRSALAAARRAARSSQASADPAVAERLRALGYAGAGAAAPAGSGEDPKDALPMWQRFEEATWASARGQHAEAVAALRRLVAERPANVAFRRSLAAALRAAGRAGEAAAVLEKAQADIGADALAWHELALALSAAGRADEALRAEERTLAVNPRLPEAHNHRGTLLAARGRLPEAMLAFSEAIRLDPNNAEAYVNRANAARAQGRREDATRDYEAAVARDPQAVGAWNGLGVLAVEKGDLARAASLFGDVLTRDPTYHEARLNLAVVLARQGRVAEARKQLQELILRAPDSEPARGARAFLRDLGAAGS
jgi:tetratricopeptide (TPR) repeat protein